MAVNAATALAKAEPGSTLLIDLNVACGDAAVFLGAEPRFSVMDALENVQRLDAAFFSGLVVRTKSGLDLLGASGRPVTGNFDAARIRALLDFASQTYRFTVLDVPRSDTVALDSLDSATKIVLVVNQELATVRTAARMAATLRQRYGQSRLHLVLTRTDRRAEIGHEDVERTVGVEIAHTFPSDYRLALQAMNKGRPLVLDAQHELSKAFSAFARELAGVPRAGTAGRKGTRGRPLRTPRSAQGVTRTEKDGRHDVFDGTDRRRWRGHAQLALPGAEKPHPPGPAESPEPRSAHPHAPGRGGAGDPEPDRRDGGARKLDACRSACSSARR